jgi:hypothetical protein
MQKIAGFIAKPVTSLLVRNRSVALQRVHSGHALSRSCNESWLVPKARAAELSLRVQPVTVIYFVNLRKKLSS